MKNNSKIIAILLVIVLVFLGLFFFKTKNNSSNTSTIVTEELKETPTEEKESFSGNFLDLLKLGKNLKCTYSMKNGDQTYEGTNYVAGSKVRTDMKATIAEDQMMESHIIVDGDYMYSWTNIADTGVKMKISDLQDAANANDTETAKQTVQNYQQKYDYDCTPWLNITNKMFELPTDVTFNDTTQMMKDLAAPKQNGKMDCSVCNYITDSEQKQECLTNLGC